MSVQNGSLKVKLLGEFSLKNCLCTKALLDYGKSVFEIAIRQTLHQLFVTENDLYGIRDNGSFSLGRCHRDTMQQRDSTYFPMSHHGSCAGGSAEDHTGLSYACKDKRPNSPIPTRIHFHSYRTGQIYWVAF